MTRVMLVRHGQASFGAADYDCLSPLGQLQANRLGAVMREQGEHVDTVVYGPMLRHRQTADAWLDAFGPVLQVRQHAAFGEFDHVDVIGCYEPRYRDHTVLHTEMISGGPGAFAAMFKSALARWQSGAHDSEYAETWQQFQRRCTAGLDELHAEGRGPEVHCVFTSGGVISAIIQSVLGLSDAAAMQLNWSLANASVSCVQRLSHGGWTLISYNEHGHFRGNRRDLLTWR